MAISAGDFRTGLTLIVDGDPCQLTSPVRVKVHAGVLKIVVPKSRRGRSRYNL